MGPMHPVSLISSQRALLFCGHDNLVVCSKPFSSSHAVQVLPGYVDVAQVPLLSFVFPLLACLRSPERIQIHHLVGDDRVSPSDAHVHACPPMKLLRAHVV